LTRIDRHDLRADVDDADVGRHLVVADALGIAVPELPADH